MAAKDVKTEERHVDEAAPSRQRSARPPEPPGGEERASPKALPTQAPPPPAPALPEFEMYEAVAPPVDLDRLFAELLEQLDGYPGGEELLPLIRRLRPVSFIGNVLQLAYDPDDMPMQDISRILQPATLDIVQECFTPVAPDPESRVVIKRWLASISHEEGPSRRKASRAEIEKIASHPFVQQVCERVDGVVVDARLRDESTGEGG